MKNIQLSCGISVQVDERILTDMEFLDAMTEAETGAPAALSTLVLKTLGKEQRSILYNALRDPDGFVPADRMTSVIVEIISAFGDNGKNS